MGAININIEVIDKKKNKIYYVSEDFKIEYKGKQISLKELQTEEKKIISIIFQEDGTIDICYRE